MSLKASRVSMTFMALMAFMALLALQDIITIPDVKALITEILSNPR